MPGPAPHRRLIKRRGETLRRHRRKDTNITGPGDAEEIAVIAPHVRDLGMASKTRETANRACAEARLRHPVRRPRRAAPLIRGVQQPHAGKIERRGDLRDLRKVRRARTLERTARKPIKRRDQRQGCTRKKSQTGVAQRARSRSTPSRVIAAGRLPGYRQRESPATPRSSQRLSALRRSVAVSCPCRHRHRRVKCASGVQALPNSRPWTQKARLAYSAS